MNDVANAVDAGGDNAAPNVDDAVVNDVQNNGADTNDSQVNGNNNDVGLISDDDSEPAPAPANWPEDWRNKLAGEDEKLLKRLDRYSSPKDVVKAWDEAVKKLGSGQYKKSLPEDATPEEMEAFKKENGIPLKAEEYDFSELPEGYMLADEDKPIADAFKEFAFNNSMDPNLAKNAVAWFTQTSDALKAEQLEADKAYKAEAIEELRTDWGAEYRSNVSLTTSSLTHMFGEELGQQVAVARLPDGSILGNNPEAMRRLADFGKRTLPGADLMPAGTADVAKGIDAEIASIEKDMKEDFHAYSRDSAKQARLLQLYEARQQRQSRSA